MTTTEIVFAVAVLVVCWLLVMVIKFSSVNEWMTTTVATEPRTVHPPELGKGDIIRIDELAGTRWVEVDSVRGNGEMWTVRWHDGDGAGESTYPEDARVPLALRAE